MPVTSLLPAASADHRAGDHCLHLDAHLVPQLVERLLFGKPHRNSENSFVPSSRRRMTGARSVGQMSSRGSRFGAALGHFTGMRV
jgi:hypothetical protein